MSLRQLAEFHIWMEMSSDPLHHNMVQTVCAAQFGSKGTPRTRNDNCPIVGAAYDGDYNFRYAPFNKLVRSEDGATIDKFNITKTLHNRNFTSMGSLMVAAYEVAMGQTATASATSSVLQPSKNRKLAELGPKAKAPIEQPSVEVQQSHPID